MGHLSSPSDHDLLQSALIGQQEAWAELVDRYHTKGFWFVRRHIDDPYLAQDIMQELWRSIVGAVQRQIPESFGALFWALLKRRIVDELRRKGRVKESSTLDAPVMGVESEDRTLRDLQSGSEPDPQDLVIQTEAQRIIQRALEQLPDHYRLAIVARQFEGRSNRETARLLVEEGLLADDGNIEKRVENYYYRGLKELRRILETLGYGKGGNGA